jgi:tetratricopeptide (TPR) repeat protein
LVIGFSAALLLLVVDDVRAQSTPRRNAGNPQVVPARAQPSPQPDTAATEEQQPRDTGYYDEPPLDYYERQWRWYTRHVRPQRFARRDTRRRYGYDAPFSRNNYPRGGFFGPLGASSYGFWGYDSYDSGEAYIQGRHDERRFSEWKARHDKGENAYVAAMDEGVTAFREADYPNAVSAFLRAAELNNGDPSSRLLGAYALVAIGNYDEAAAKLYEALKLQSRLYYLSLDIRAEYGPKVDFDAHYQRLQEAVQAAEDDPDLLTLQAFYAYFSGDRAAARESLDRAIELAPRDRVIGEFHRAVSAMTPRRAYAKPAEPAPPTPTAPKTITPTKP